MLCIYIMLYIHENVVALIQGSGSEAKALAAMPDEWSSIPETHIGGGKNNSFKLSSDHMSAMTHTHVHTHNTNK